MKPFLALAVLLPAIVVVRFTEEHDTTLVLYREPKLVAVQLLSWFILAMLVWSRGTRLLPRLRPGRQPLPILWALLAYAALTVAWVKVPGNFAYEFLQYLCLAPLVIALAAWNEDDPSVEDIVLAALVLSLAVVFVVGTLQPWFPLSWLPPTDPASPVQNPSLMGYKNPTAQALLGQLFLLASLTLSPTHRRRRAVSFLLALLLGAELVYLVSLRSRTVYFALVVGAGYSLVVALLRRRQAATQLLRAGLIVAVLLAAGLALNDAARERAGSLLHYISHPGAFLESDRGTYLLNTLNMVRHNPFGVGLGDWQTHYPVYRLHHRTLYFTRTEQVQRAHSDHVQILGELGWPGFVLWCLFLASLLLLPTRRYQKHGDLKSLFLAAQVAAYIAAMATDYVVELPYNKFEFFLCLFLVLARCPPPSPRLPAVRIKLPTARSVALAVTVAAALSSAYHCSLLYRHKLSSAFTESYRRALPLLRDDDPLRRIAGERLLAETARRGELFDRLPGHVKRAYSDYLVLAHVAALRGLDDAALDYARKALDRHPYQPATMGLLATVLRDRDPEAAASWRRAEDYVLHEATEGFVIPYPPVP